MEASVLDFSTSTRARRICLGLVVLLSCARLAHVSLLWADEDYHLAAAIQLLHGKIPYRDFWYDKPPLNAVYYLLIGGFSGWPLRILDALYILLACYLVYRVARVWWGEAEALTSAALLAFFTTFYLPSAVIPFAADALMMVPHLVAIYCALRRRPLLAGFWAGVAFLFNPKGLFVLAACAVWLINRAAPARERHAHAFSRTKSGTKSGTGYEFPQFQPTENKKNHNAGIRSLSPISVLLAGFAAPLIVGSVCTLWLGAWPGYLEQVWRWGFIYATGSPVLHPLWNGTVRTLDWLGFHAALAVGGVAAFFNISRADRWKLAWWLALSFAGVCLGSRFAPHYFLQLLPPAAIAASRGIIAAYRARGKSAALILALLLIVPFVRFGPRYVSLAYDDVTHTEPRWSDIAMDLDSQEAARRIRSSARPGDTLFVWGYRPDLYVYTRMVPNGLFSDSQPLTGVPADRHLSAISAIYGGPAAANRDKLKHSRPTWLVDGLGLLNPKLKPSVYPELRPWLANYKLVDRTNLSLIYRRIE